MWCKILATCLFLFHLQILNCIFWCLVHGKNTPETLQNNSVTQVRILTFMKWETLRFIKCFQVHNLIWHTQQLCEVGLGLVPLIYLTGKKGSRKKIQWLAQCHIVSYETSCWSRCSYHPYSITFFVIIISWAPRVWSIPDALTKSHFSRWHKRKGKNTLLEAGGFLWVEAISYLTLKVDIKNLVLVNISARHSRVENINNIIF